MTRGTFYAVTDDLVVETVEFNGDMYPEGHGEEAIAMFENCKTLRDFRDGIGKFNSNNHNYSENLFYPQKKSRFMRGGIIKMDDKTYFDKFFSDWTFWKNLSSKTVTIKTRENKNIILLPNEQVAINFGRYEDHYKSKKECNEIIKQRELAYQQEKLRQKNDIHNP